MGLFDNMFKKISLPKKIDKSGEEVIINPNGLAFGALGLNYYWEQNYSAAVTNFTKAIESQSNNQNLYIMRGTAFEDMGRDVEAAKDFSKALELSPNNFLAAYRLGMVYSRKKDLENAVNYLKVAFENSPQVELSVDDLGTNNILFVHKKIISGNLGTFLTQMNQFEEGHKYLDEAIRIDPQYCYPYMAKGLAYAQCGKIKDAISYLNKAIQLGIPQASLARTLLEQLSEESENSGTEELVLDFIFHSYDHLRFENGIHVSGPHGGAGRAVKVEPNINGGEGFTVTIYNLDGNHPVWQNNIQIAPKQMRVIEQIEDKIVLRGYGFDAFGSPFSDYGLTIIRNVGEIEKCVLHMHDRDIDIVYLKSAENVYLTGTDYSDEINSFLKWFETLPMVTKIELTEKTDQLNNHGVSFYKNDDIENAINYFHKALEIYPINDDALNNLILCYNELGNMTKMQAAKNKLDYIRKLDL